MKKSEDDLLLKEVVIKELQAPPPSPPPPPPTVESDDVNHAVLEILAKEFQNLVLQETRNQNNDGEEIQRENTVEKDDNRQGEKPAEEYAYRVEKDELTADEDANREEWPVEQVKEVRDGWTIEENENRDGWTTVQENGWTMNTVEQVNEIRDGWGIEENGNPDRDDGWTAEENGYGGEGENGYGEGKERAKKSQYPSRPGELDCVFYIKTGTCGFGSNCKFNHPRKKKTKVQSSSTESEESIQGVEEKPENHKRVGRLECKYYLTPGGCKFGKACRYHHPREKNVVEPPAEFNFLGLPIRPGARECPFYMRTGSCKFATNCRFNHPDPTAGGSDSGYDSSSSVPLHASTDSQSAVASWSIPRPSTDTVPYSDSSLSYMPVMLQPQGVHSGLEWNGYQAPGSPLYPPMASSLNGSNKNADGYSHHLQQMPVEEFPERPGQKECQYYMNTGNCKYKSACRFHHPKARYPKSPSLSPLGLPLRPDQIVCSHYSRYGICKYGAACKYDHTPNPNSPASPVATASVPHPYYHNSATFGGPNMAGYGDGSKPLVQQYL